MNEMDEIVGEFIEESYVLLDEVSEDILVLEARHDDEIVNRVYRVFHSIKGNASMLGFKNLSVFAHKAEDLLSLVRTRQVKVDKPVANLLLNVVDTLILIIDDVKEGIGDGHDTSEMQAKLSTVIEGARSGTTQAPAATPEKPKPSPVPPPPKPAVTEPPATATATAQPSVKPPADEEHPAKGLKILIVEDDFTSRQILYGYLSKLGDVHVAKNGEEAIEAFTYTYMQEPPEPYDLVCMDVNMPKVDGTQATKTIREIETKNLQKNQYVKESVILMVSAESDPATIIKACYECGANYYLLKPIDFSQMNKQLTKLGLLKLP